ncbi:dirigent protein 11 [Amborella trichopoda]|uniref:Dirigent protein n=1 Tax=Amborella trichopoda TaxID=13333 RepID=W1Q0E7_AMBTC|nr:dirigent protein 11 [Amborella trichopoda]ERN13405.1 hypothetical protein AMTR_s00041p00178600 [Amborella trichopoda]|eukprot:XP_006851938.1 dirigent protein 11 [Amborella trichopoda]
MRGKAALATGVASLLLFFSSMPICQAKLGLGEPKVSQIEFYMHDLLVTEKPTAVIVAEANTTKSSPTLFGQVVVVDDPMTEGPELTSKLIGKAQGLYAPSSQSEISLSEAVNFVFIDGKFNGSTLSVMGRNPILYKERELWIIGGSGAFRLARGYALKQTYSFDTTTLNAVVHYNVTVIHC